MHGVVWCGVVWCGVVWCDAMRCDAMRCDAMPRIAIRIESLWRSDDKSTGA